MKIYYLESGDKMLRNFKDELLLIQKDLMTLTNMGIVISDLLGFEDSSYFTKLFKKYELITPSEYKNRLR